MRSSPLYIENIPANTERPNEQMHITEALNLLEWVKARWNINSALLTEIKLAQTELLQMQEVWISYVGGVLLVMLNNLEKLWAIPLNGLTQAFTDAVNDKISV